MERDKELKGLIETVITKSKRCLCCNSVVIPFHILSTHLGVSLLGHINQMHRSLKGQANVPWYDFLLKQPTDFSRVFMIFTLLYWLLGSILWLSNFYYDHWIIELQEFWAIPFSFQSVVWEIVKSAYTPYNHNITKVVTWFYFQMCQKPFTWAHPFYIYVFIS